MNDQQPTSGGRRRLLVVALAIALAALVAVLLIERARGASDLPAYALTFTMGEEVGRGEPVKAVPELKRGSRFVLTLRPATPPKGPLSARAFLVQAGKPTPIESALRISAEGVFQLSARIPEALRPTPGEGEIVTVIGRPGALPADVSLSNGEGRRVVRHPVRMLESP
jgi:hypothetical protein